MNRKQSQERGSITPNVIFCIVIVILLVTFFVYIKRHICTTKFNLINKEFACGEKPVLDKKGYAALQKRIETYIEDKKKNSDVSEVSVYFRDLLDGPVFGINEFKDFAPASLLKLPFALTYLKEAEELDPDILQEKILFTSGSSEFLQTFVPEETLKPGESYTIEDLLRRMLSYSDNNASDLLAAQLENTGRKDIIRETLLELGILAPDDPFDKVVSVRRYSSIFRGLYNVSLLNSENSNKVLKWLSESKFLEGLPSGVPKDMKVAHKFGERLLEDRTRQLHDCGIIYFPNNPYLLCIMTHGDVYKNLEDTIKDISKMVYQEVDSRKI